MDRPNVLLLYTDQQRWDALGCSGNPRIHTPNLDALAQTGAVFTNAFCNNPVCMPSRQSMLSGRYPSTLGCACNGVEMPEDMPTLHTILKPYGYHTANIGKLHFRNHSVRDHREPHPGYGFDTLTVSDEPGCYDDAYIKWVAEQDPAQVPLCRVSAPPAYQGPQVKAPPRTAPYAFQGREDLTHSAFVAEETARYIRGHKGETFCAIAGFFAPHAPLNPPQRFIDIYDPAELPLPAQWEGEADLGMKRPGYDDDLWRRIKAHYYALTTHVDDQIGRILDALDQTGAHGNTIVVFTSDHGDHLGDHGVTGKGPPCWDSCCHVPLIVSWPARIQAGMRRGQIIEAVDLLPTILDLCGVQTPPFAQGRSFRPLLTSGEYEERSSAFIEYKVPFGASWKAVRGRDYMYAADNSGRELLYDLHSDPNQLHTVADSASCADALHAMRRELIGRWFDVENQYPRRTGSY